MGPRTRAVNTTAASPRWTYPCVPGIGTFGRSVRTAVTAASTATAAMRRAVERAGGVDGFSLFTPRV